MDSSVPTGLEPDEAVARFFLNLCQPTHLAAIPLGGAVQGCRAATIDEAAAWACAANRRRANVYWTVNDVGSFAGAKPDEARHHRGALYPRRVQRPAAGKCA